MELYLLKSAACLAVLLLFYKLLLEKEDMHQFNRFYLLFSVIISFTVPFISFTTYVEVPLEPSVAEASYDYLLPPSPPPAQTPTPIWPSILWGIYGLGVIFFSWKFGKNLKELLLRIRRNPKLKIGSFTNVLIREDIIPHTFLDYIFLNKKKFEEHAIPQEVFEHEQAHAKQKHSYDILFMELLQILFWFHPLLYLVKRAIKLNHEFLADKSVLKKGASTAAYQQTLLAFSSNDLHSSLVNPINYSFIKKRFTVMKTQTSRKAIWLRSLLVLPIMAALLYGFSTKKVEERKIQSAISPSEIAHTLKIDVDGTGNIFVDGKKTSLTSIRKNIEPGNYLNVSINAAEEAPAALLEELITAVLELNFSGSISYYIPGDGEKAYILQDKVWSNSEMEPASPEIVAEYNKLVAYYNSLPENSTLPKKDSERIKKLHSLLNLQQRREATAINFNLPAQEEATAKMIAEYNKLAKKYNSQTGETSLIPQKDMARMKSIYNLMTPEQKKQAEPLPEPEVIEVVGYGMANPEQKKNAEPQAEVIEVMGYPTATQEKATSEMVKEYNKLAKMVREYNKLSKNGESLPNEPIFIRIKDLDRMRYIHSIMTEEQKRKAEPLPGFYPPPPPPPPAPALEEYAPEVPEPPKAPTPPPAPMEQLKELAEQGARFFIKGKGEISANEALDLVRGEKKVRIQVTEYEEYSTVHISLED